LAGLLLLWSGEEVFASRWAPMTLAVTHLITAGFMLQVMLGALIQILPVVAGANLLSPTRLAGSVHASLTLAALFLTAAFMSFSPHWFKVSALFFVVGVAAFVISAALALRGVPSTSATVRGLKLALAGLSVTVVLGVLLAAVLGWSLSLPLIELADVHLTWGFLAWGLVLLASVAYVVVPMFQLTPAYPARFERWFVLAILPLTTLWSLAYLSGSELISTILSPPCACSSAANGSASTPASAAGKWRCGARWRPARYGSPGCFRRHSATGRAGRCCAACWFCSAGSSR
ncbi:MAG: hypothetical protein ABI478_08635, partial [Propionivibrio sp.]